MACKTDTGQSILEIINVLQNDISLLQRFVQGEDNENVPLGEPVATPTPTLRHLAKNVMDAIDYFSNEWSKAADPLALDSYAFNVRRSRIMPDDVAAGSLVTLPVTYYPGRDILLVVYRGEVCTPRKQDDWNPGERQYEEVANPDVPPYGNASNYPSTQIIVSFDIKKGSNLDCWVVASNLMKEMGVLLAARDEAVHAAEVATEQAIIATEQAEYVTALISEKVLELGVTNPSYSWRADKDYSPGDTLTMPISYYPRRGLLVLVYKGEICTPYALGQSDNFQYREVGVDPLVRVNQIIVEFPIKQNDPIFAMVWASAAGRNLEELAALTSEVKVAASNAILASQSVYNKADKYFASVGPSESYPLRGLTSSSTISHLDFTTAGLPGDMIYAGRITFSDNSYLEYEVDQDGKQRFSWKDAADTIRQLFYIQGSGWAVTSTWEFPTPMTVSVPLPAGVPAGPSLWDTVLGVQMDAVTVDPQYNYINKPQRSELQSVLTDANYGNTSASVYVTLSVYNALTQQASQQQRDFPLASATNPGAMPAESYQALAQAVQDIQALQQQGGRFIGTGFPTYAALQAYVIPSTVNIGDFTYVEHDETHANSTCRYICSDNGSGGKVFKFAYVIQEEPYGFPTPTDAGIVLNVASSAAAGKVFFETDGTGSVLGWDALNTRVTNNATAITALQNQVAALGGTIFVGTTAPSNTGAMWVNMTDFCCYIYNGTKWVRLTGVYQENAGV